MPKQIYAKEYEEYLITGKEEALNSLASGSIEKEYFTLIRRLLKEELTPELQKDIESFLRRIPENQSYRLKALNIFKKLQKTPTKKTEIIQDIKNLFDLGEVTPHSKPVKYNKTSTNQKDENKAQKLPNSLNINQYIKINKFIEDVYSGAIVPTDEEYNKYFGNGKATLTFDFNKIPEKTLVQIFSKRDDFREVSGFINESMPSAKLDYFKKVIDLSVKECIKKEETKKKFELFFRCSNNLLLNEQIDVLLEYRNIFNFDRLVSDFLSRKYVITIDKKEKLKILKEKKELLNKFKYKDDIMTRYCLINILDLNSQMNIFELETFIEYIQVPLYDNDSFYNISNVLRNKIMNNKENDNYINEASYINLENDRKIVEKHLKHFYLKEKMPFETFNKYFNENYIKNFYSKMQFYLGSEEPTKDNILSANEINDLMKEIQLTICDFNKEVFNYLFIIISISSQLFNISL